MIIRQPRISEKDGELCVSASIEIANPIKPVPEALWFRFPLSYGDYVTDRSDAFAVAMLPVAMRLGEDMIVEGRVSPRLAYGMREYQFLQHAWWPCQAKIIKTTYDELKECDEQHNKGAVACTFSGGVDSFFTLWTHLPKNEDIKEYRLTHGLMINGFSNDVDLDNTGYLKNLMKIYEPMLNNHGVELLVSRTNLMHVRLAGIEPKYTGQSWGAEITASALVLGRLLSRFYMASSYKYDALLRDGGHPLLDHLLSTETLDIIHDGAGVSRFEKTGTIAQWPETYSKLRGCFKTTEFNAETGKIENCCKCEKCIRTMTALELHGALSRYTSFPHPLTGRRQRRAWMIRKGARVFAKENLDYAVKIGRRDVVRNIRLAKVRGAFLRAIGIPAFKACKKIMKR